jgi:hypothetical protein
MNLTQDLKLTTQLIFDKNRLECTQLHAAPESAEYAAFTFKINEKYVHYREAKITPTKIGQFVTFWKRDKNGITASFDVSDDLDFAIISVRKETQWGLFIFTKKILHEHGILSDENRDGKRGFRVYPPWDIAENKQAIKTQIWQSKHFFDVNSPDFGILQ